jgi:hypothetical protein
MAILSKIKTNIATFNIKTLTRMTLTITQEGVRGNELIQNSIQLSVILLNVVAQFSGVKSDFYLRTNFSLK